MRFRSTHLAVLLLLLSSLAVSDARAGNVEQSRTPGGVFVRNLLLQAAVDEVESAASGTGHLPLYAAAEQTLPDVVRTVRDASQQTAHVHAVTGSSL